MNMINQPQIRQAYTATGCKPVLSLKNVTLRYRTDASIVTAACDVSFDVHRGDRFILLGASGCGKSSLLKAVGGFLKPVAGEIRLDGRIIHAPGPDRMMVFQEFDQLLPWKTILQNVAYPMQKSKQWSAADVMDRAKLFTAKVGLEKFGDAYPHTLSGGMKQRVAIARSLSYDPDILLMDEPFAALDAQTREILQDELLRIWEQTAKTILFITHGIEEAVYLAQRVAVMSARPGRILDIIDIPLGPRRGDEDLRSSPEFAQLRHHIWASLRDQIQTATRH
jgi:NitT/TauT family transport system ATP-binding protein